VDVALMQFCIGAPQRPDKFAAWSAGDPAGLSGY
jgi:hypothetical protein